MDNETQTQLQEIVDRLDTGKKVVMPLWASFFALASVVVRKPVSVIPNLIIIIVAGGMTIIPDSGITFLEATGILAFVLPASVVIATGSIARTMSADGVLANYLALICSQYRIPRWLADNQGGAR